MVDKKSLKLDIMEMVKWVQIKVKCNECGKDFEKARSLVQNINYCLECCQEKDLCPRCYKLGRRNWHEH